MDAEDTIIITEKPSQARDVRAAVGDQYGRILAAQGHLLELEEPEDVNKEGWSWAAWDFEVLRPALGHYRTKVPKAQGAGAKDKLRAIQDALKRARRVIIATDCDREGQVIGQELIEHFGFKGEVLRAMFTAQDAKTLQAAFAALEPNGKYDNLYRAGWARRQADQIYNLTLTRAASKALNAGRGALGVGRVKTPTLAIVCLRELEIEGFKAQDYFEIAADGRQEGMDEPVAFRHAGEDKQKILNRTEAEAMARAADGFTGPLAVTKEAKRRRPPALMDLPGLQKACGKFGWSAEKTLQTAQELYDGDAKKIITYPRAEAKHLTENQIGDAETIIKGLCALDAFAAIGPFAPVIRKGRGGVFSDKALEGVSHHAIIPNVNATEDLPTAFAGLNDDEKTLFDLIARRYLAAMMPDWEYERTEAKVLVDAGGAAMAFTAAGNVTTAPGWQGAMAGFDDDKDKDTPLPPLQDGRPIALDNARIETKTTKPPPRYNEGGLVEAMQNAWRFVPDGPHRERLKDAKGIGTPATRADVIKGLKAQGQLEVKGKHLVPTQTGMAVFTLLKEKAPPLVDPGTTALWELRLDEVARGSEAAQTVIGSIAAQAGEIMAALKAARGGLGAHGGGANPPTAKMLKLARMVSGRKGVPLAEDAAKSFDACKAFLDEHAGGPLPPSEKQAALVEKIAKEKGVTPPDGWREDARAASAFLDAHLGSSGKGGGPAPNPQDERT